VLRTNVFQKLLAKYRTGKVPYQDLKRELEKLSGRLRTLRFEILLLPFRSHTSILRCCFAHRFA
jgi:hypothetical protein